MHRLLHMYCLNKYFKHSLFEELLSPKNKKSILLNFRQSLVDRYEMIINSSCNYRFDPLYPLSDYFKWLFNKSQRFR